MRDSRRLDRCLTANTEERELTPEEKLERSRIRNRDHSRKSRQRKKALVEGMKKQVNRSRTTVSPLELRNEHDQRTSRSLGNILRRLKKS